MIVAMVIVITAILAIVIARIIAVIVRVRRASCRSHGHAVGLFAGRRADPVFCDPGGMKEAPEKKKNPAVGFFKRFWGFTAWMLELTIALAYFLGKYLDLIVIAALLPINAILGFVREQHVDLEKGDALEGSYHLVASSMALHRIKEIEPVLERISGHGPRRAPLHIADLDADDGQLRE